MPRKRQTTLSIERAEPAYVALDAACGKPEAARWWTVAVQSYWKYCQVVLRESDQSSAATLGRAVVEQALDVIATIVFRDPHVKKRWRHVRNVRDVLEGLLPAALGGPLVIVNPNLHLDSPRGRRFGAPVPQARTWDEKTINDFPNVLERVERRFHREHVRRPRWTDELAADLHLTSPTLRRFLAKEPTLRQQLAEASARYANSER